MTGYIRADSCFLLLRLLILQSAVYFLLHNLAETVGYIAGPFMFNNAFAALAVRFAF